MTKAVSSTCSDSWCSFSAVFAIINGICIHIGLCCLCGIFSSSCSVCANSICSLYCTLTCISVLSNCLAALCSLFTVLLAVLSCCLWLVCSILFFCLFFLSSLHTNSCCDPVLNLALAVPLKHWGLERLQVHDTRQGY